MTIPSTVKSIGDYAFSNCSGLTNLTLSEGVAIIGDYAFYNCSGLTSATIPGSVKSIGVNAFYDCSGLTSVTIGNGVTSIGDGAFFYCSGLTSVTIPNSVISIGNSAFYDCSGLTSVKMSSGVASIGDHAFCGCSGLTGALTIPSGVVSIGSYAFYDCSGLTGALTIPRGVTRIGSYAFCGCSGFTALTMPNSVASVGNSAFAGCVNLKSVAGPFVPSGIEDVVASVTIPAGVTDIPGQAFSGCRLLAEIVLPDTVTNIGAQAFMDCVSLSNVILPEALLEVGSQAFKNCTALPALTFPAGVERIGTGACAGDVSLASVLMPEKVLDIPADMFRGCRALPSLALPIGTQTIGAGAFFDCGMLEAMTVPSGVKSIGADAFRNCSSLVSVTIPGSVKTVGANAFAGCGKIETAIVPDAAVSGPLAGFFPDAWQKVRKVVVAEGPDVIADGAFRNCKELASVVVPASVLQLGEDVFFGCKSLKEVHYMGNAPNFGAVLYTGTPLELVSFVQYGSMGWSGGISTELPETWPISFVVGNIRIDARGIQHEKSDMSVPTVCTVTFDARGGRVSPAVRQVMTGTAIGTLPIPVRANYAFQGWFTASGGGSQITKDTKVEANATYYAHWMSGQSLIGTVTFDPMGGGGTMEPWQFYVGFDASLPKCEFGKSGYAFAGWSLAPNGAKAWNDQQQVRIDKSTVQQVYAIWLRPNCYGIAFDPGVENAEWSMGYQSVGVGKVAKLNPCAFTPPAGKRFAGWRRKGTGRRYDDGVMVFNLASESGAVVVLEAVWEDIP